MSSSFPNSIKIWSPADTAFRYPQDLTTIVYARHITQVYDEVTSMQQELGAGGLKTSVLSNPGSFTSIDGNVWGSLRLRLNNMEQGVITGVTRRVSTLGGSTVTPSTSSTVGVAIRAASGQTANLLEFRDSSNTVVNRFGSDGLLAGVIDGGNA
jgi:hypothetical protein